MNIETATKQELLNEIIFDDSLYSFIGRDAGLMAFENADEETIRAKVRQWIQESPEA